MLVLQWLTMRRQGRELARQQRLSLAQGYYWKIEPLPANVEGARLSRGAFAIVLMPCDCCLKFIRVFDQCKLHYCSADVYVPLLARIRLRNAARVYVQAEALSKKSKGTKKHDY